MAEDKGAAAHHLKRSADAVATATSELSDSADRRTLLAADRTLLAAERTYAAWVRTALAALASGVGGRALLAKAVPDWLGRATASVLILFAAFCLVAAVWRQLQRGVPPPHPDLKPVPHGFLLFFNGFLLLVCAAALLGMWIG
ncbi:MAG: putative rane protein [Sphingomonadales bacterium]|nr:putative rane protein [Sphingomonadales bacterium]MEA3035600.1 putative rane protein [Sphingomonadales bacterium]